MKRVLTIAGSDCSGGAGIQADLKTMSALGVYGMSVITAVTAQNTREVRDVQDITPEMVAAQLDAVFSDIRVDAVKVGMVSNCDIIRIIRDKLVRYGAVNIVVDPVMVSKSGYHLLKPDAVAAVSQLLAVGDVATPNIPEAALLTGMELTSEADMREAGKRIRQMGAKHVLVKGGHRLGNASDLLVMPQGERLFKGERIDTDNTHGTGCTLSSAIASYLALGFGVEQAVERAKDYITQAIRDNLPIGHGVGPVGHLVDLYRRAGMEIEQEKEEESRC